MAGDLPSISSSQEEKLPLWPIQAPGACGGGDGLGGEGIQEQPSLGDR